MNDDMNVQAGRAAAVAREDCLAEVIWGLELWAKALGRTANPLTDGVAAAAEWVRAVAEAEQ